MQRAATRLKPPFKARSALCTDLFSMKPRKRFFGPLCFALLWAIILGVPRLRALAVYQFISDDDVSKAALWLAPLARFFPQRYENYEAFAARYPDDPRVQWWETGDLGFERAQNLEPLIRRFPQEAWLHADYLVSLCGGFQSGRVPGTLAAPAMGVAPPAEKPANLNATQIKRAIEVCRQGAKLEPQNCLWNLMEAIFLFGARRDNEALQVLQRGSQKNYYDDHVLEGARKNIEVRDLLRLRVVEEKWLILNYTLLPHVSRIREVARLATWKAMQKQARGDWKNALQIRSDMARLGAKMGDQDGFYITTLVGFAVQSLPYRAGATVPSNWPAQSRNQTQLWAKHFANLCRAHGRADLAREAELDEKTSAQLQQQLQSLMTPPTILLGVSNRDWIAMLGLNWVGASLLMQLLITLPLWVFLSLLLWWKRVPGKESSGGAAFLIWLAVMSVCLTIAGATVYAGGGWARWEGFALNGITTPPVLQDAAVSVIRWLIALAPILLGALFCGILGAWRHRKQGRVFDVNVENKELMRPILRRNAWLVISSLILIFSGVVLWNLISGAATLRFTLNAFFVDPAAWITRFFMSPLFALNLIVFAVFWWIFSGVWMTPRDMKAAAGENLKWYRQTLGATLVYGSALYLLLLVVSLQARRPAEVAFDIVLQHGETGVMKTSLGTPHGAKTR